MLCSAVYAKDLLRIFISCPKQLNADCTPGGNSYKKGRDVRVDGMAFGFGVKLHLDICVACGHSIDLQSCEIPLGQPELVICELFNIHRAGMGNNRLPYTIIFSLGDYLRPLQAVTFLA